MKNDTRDTWPVTVKAPFSKRQISALRKFQKRRDVHKFSCHKHSCDRPASKGYGILIPTNEGMVCPCGEYKQDWVYKSMLVPKSRGRIVISVPLLGNSKFFLCIKWRNLPENSELPWIGIGIYPKND